MARAVLNGAPTVRRVRELVMGDEMLKYAAGDRVVHLQYGDGTLTSVNEYHTVIDFDLHGARTFSTPRVVLAISSTPAPPAKPAKRARRAKRLLATVSQPIS